MRYWRKLANTAPMAGEAAPPSWIRTGSCDVPAALVESTIDAVPFTP
ncbi:hypothetical protein RKD37_007790 [Streptomyces ambofaciens]